MATAQAPRVLLPGFFRLGMGMACGAQSVLSTRRLAASVAVYAIGMPWLVARWIRPAPTVASAPA